MNKLIIYACLIGFVIPLTRGLGFHVETKEGLNIYWQGKPLVVSDEIHLLEVGALAKPEGERKDLLNGFSVVNQWKDGGKGRDVRWRREVAWNDREVNGTMQFQVPAWYPLRPGMNCTYQLQIPYETVQSMRYEGASGRNLNTKVTGILHPDMADGPIGNIGSLRYLALSSPLEEGESRDPLLFDFSPAGPARYRQGAWVEKRGTKLLITFGALAEQVAPFFGVWEPKWRLSRQTAADYESLHAERNFAYFGHLPQVFMWSFGLGELPVREISREYEDVPGARGWAALHEPFDSWKSVETSVWEHPEGVEEQGNRGKGVLHARVLGKGDNYLSFQVPEPGIYLLTLRISAGEVKIGPGSITCNEEQVVSGLEIHPGEVKVITFPRYLHTRHGVLSFSGEWAVSSFSAQALLYQAEDDVFEKGFWFVQDVPTPLPNMYSWQSMPIPTRASIQTLRRHEPEQPWSEKLFHQLRVASAHPDEPEKAWRYVGDIGGLGPENNGNFHEFETEEDISRRLDEFEAAGYRVLLLNGLLFRHCWPDQFDRVKETIARIVTLANERGIPVIDHFDLTVVPNQGTGYRVLLENLDHTLRDVRNGQITRGFCINNPEFKDAFFLYLDDWILKTGINGLMLDEVAFHTRGFCGCVYCREKFLQDTGQVLPVDETSPELLNQESALWKLWLAWRNQCVGDWFEDMRNLVRQRDEQFVLLYYSAPMGMSTSIFTRRPGGTITDAVRGSDYLGTETISRNVHATWRSNLAHRAIFQSLRRAFNVPVFNLIYAQANPDIAYSGWAMNRMYAQVTWDSFRGDALLNSRKLYAGWTGGFDLLRAKSVPNIGVLFSEMSRDYSSEEPYFIKRVLGMCEQLGDWHQPYDVLLESHLTAQELAVYPLVILPSNKALSDKTLALLRNYLEQGGRVLAMGEAGIEGELGVRRHCWELGEWIGLELSDTKIEGPLRLQGEMVDQVVDNFDFSIPTVSLGQDAPEQTRILVSTLQGNAVAVAEGVVGQGTLMVVLPPLGEIRMEPEWNVGQVFKRDEHQSILLKRLVIRMLGDQRVFVPVNIPQEVALTYYEQPGVNGTQEAILHFYNGTGARMNQGQRVPRLPSSDPFPPVMEDIVFEVALPFEGEAKAVMRSPDWDGEVKLEIVHDHEGRVTVRIPSGSLHAYAVVHLKPEGVHL